MNLEQKRDEIRAISKIAARAVQLAAEYGFVYPHIDAMMDLEHAHNQCPLKLNELLIADAGNFGHDVFGIRKHMNRETGQLEGCFTPRYSA